MYMHKIKMIVPSVETLNADVGTQVKRALGVETPPEAEPVHALIKQIHDAVLNESIQEPFTSRDIEDWMERNNIRQGNGEKYSRGYAATLLSTSYIGKKMKNNKNSIWLDRRKNKDGEYEYWFDD